MKTKLCSLLLALAARIVFVHAATITWTNTSGGNWTNAVNWNPNQVPTNTDVVQITTPGTYTVTITGWLQSYGGYGTINSLALGAGGGAAGVQTLAMTNLDLFFTNLLVTGGGVLTAVGIIDSSYGSQKQTMTVANGGVFNMFGSYLFDTLIVTNGGVLNSSNSLFYGAVMVTNSVFNSSIDSVGALTVANGGVLNAVKMSISGVIVAGGGVMNVMNAAGFALPEGILTGVLANYGTINITNAGFLFGYGDYPTLNGGIVNQPGGVINLSGTVFLGSSVGFGETDLTYITNKGSLIQTDGAGSTVSVGSFDNTQGTITNLSGTLVLGLFQTNLAGGYSAAPGATIQFVGAATATPLVPGTPFVLSGNGQFQLTSGYLSLPTDWNPKLTLMGTTLVLGPGFQGGAITNLALDGIQLVSNTLPVMGIVSVTNSSVGGNFTVAGGGLLVASNSSFQGAVTVASGGLVSANGCRANTLTVAAGGTVDLAGSFYNSAPLTNSGTLNLTNATMFITKGIVNQAGGQIALSGTGNSIQGAIGTEYFVNQGHIAQNSAPGTTNTIQYFANLDDSLGTVSNLSGTLLMANFQTNLAGTFFAAAGATIQFNGGTAAAPLVPGVLILGGGGQFQFISGYLAESYLYLPANTIANLTLLGGVLELGPGFQGGAITNLTLDGIKLTNQLSTTLPITGTFTVRNSGGWYYDSSYHLVTNGVYGNFTVAGGGTLTMTNSDLHGALTVANGGVFNAQRAHMYGAVTVASGAVLDIFKGYLDLYAPLTNSGTINQTNAGISVNNDGTPSSQGSVINQAGGLIADWDTTASGQGGSYMIGSGYASLVNQGRIIKNTGAGFAYLEILATNSGTIAVQTGPLWLGRQWTLLPAGSLNVGLNSTTNYGSIIFSTNSPFNPVGNAGLTGAFNATLNNGYVPTNGTTFNVMSYGSFTGNFTSVGLPATVAWQSSYGSTNFTLIAGSAKAQFGAFNLVGTNLIFDGIGGSPGSNYVILASTNLALPLTNWSALKTNSFDGAGHFNYTNNVSADKPSQFFILKIP